MSQLENINGMTNTKFVALARSVGPTHWVRLGLSHTSLSLSTFIFSIPTPDILISIASSLTYHSYTLTFFDFDSWYTFIMSAITSPKSPSGCCSLSFWYDLPSRHTLWKEPLNFPIFSHIPKLRSSKPPPSNPNTNRCSPANSMH